MGNISWSFELFLRMLEFCNFAYIKINGVKLSAVAKATQEYQDNLVKIKIWKIINYTKLIVKNLKYFIVQTMKINTIVKDCGMQQIELLCSISCLVAEQM